MCKCVCVYQPCGFVNAGLFAKPPGLIFPEGSADSWRCRSPADRLCIKIKITVTPVTSPVSQEMDAGPRPAASGPPTADQACRRGSGQGQHALSPARTRDIQGAAGAGRGRPAPRNPAAAWLHPGQELAPVSLNPCLELPVSLRLVWSTPGSLVISQDPVSKLHKSLES